MIGRRTMLTASCGIFTASVAFAQQEFTFIVPAGVGGSADITSRLLSSKLSELGISSKVINRSAGAGVEGTMHVFRSQPDSGTFLIGGPNGLLLAPARENLPYTANSFEPVCMFSSATFGMAIKTGKASSLKDLLDQGKTKHISVGTAASEAHYLVDTLFSLSGSKLTHIPYRGAGDAVRDLLAGVIDAAYVSIASIAGAVQSGDAMLLVHTTDDGQPLRSFSDVPHISTLGFDHPALYAYHWHGIYAPRGISKSITEHLTNSVRIICNNIDFIAAHDSRGMIIRYMDADNLKMHHIRTIDKLINPYMKWLENNR